MGNMNAFATDATERLAGEVICLMNSMNHATRSNLIGMATDRYMYKNKCRSDTSKCQSGIVSCYSLSWLIALSI